MEFPFPPPSSDTVFRHYALMMWLVLLLGILVWRLYRPVRGWEPLFWLPGIGFVTLIFLHPPWDRDIVPFRPELTTGMFVASLAVALVGCSESAARLQRKGRTGWATAGMIVGFGSVLVICLLPAMGRAGAAARRSNCNSNMWHLGIAFHDWHDQHDRFPDVDNAHDGNPPLSWRVAMLRHLESDQLHRLYDDEIPWNDPSNYDVARTKSPTLMCPANWNGADPEGRRYTAYVMVTGPGTIAPGGKGLSFREITDGTSNTLLLVEAAGLNVVWTEPRDFDVATQPLGVNLPGNAPGRSPGLLSSYHADGAIAVFADGSVSFIHDDVDPQVLRAISTATGGEDVDRGAW